MAEEMTRQQAADAGAAIAARLGVNADWIIVATVNGERQAMCFGASNARLRPKTKEAMLAHYMDAQRRQTAAHGTDLPENVKVYSPDEDWHSQEPELQPAE